MAAGVSASAVDSALRKLICFNVGMLCNHTSSDNGNNKVGFQLTKIDWNKYPTSWPEHICFKNPNKATKMNKVTTSEKWAMLFASLSCLLRKDIDKLLGKYDYFTLCVELMALENSKVDIMQTCNVLRALMKQDLNVLKTPWAKETYSNGLHMIGLSLVESADKNHSNFLTLYDDLEKECENGQLPDFLRHLKTFSSMKSLDAESALAVAKECLEQEAKATANATSNQGQQNSRKRPTSSSKAPKKTKRPKVTCQNLNVPSIPTSKCPIPQTEAPFTSMSPISSRACPISHTSTSLTTSTTCSLLQTNVSWTTSTKTNGAQIPLFGTSDPLLSRSGAHQPILPVITSDISLHEQARLTFTDGSMLDQDSSWRPSQGYCDTVDNLFPLPDPF